MVKTAASAVPVPASERWRGHLAMLCFAALIAGSFTFGKLAVAHIAPLPLNAVRFLIGAAVMGIVVFGIQRHRMEIPAAPWRFAVLGGLMAAYFVAMFIALTMTSPVSTSAIFTLMPIMTAFFAFFLLGQIVTPLGAVSFVFAGLGSVWVIFRGDIQALLAFDIGPGEMIFFGGCICHALFAALLRKFSRGEPAMVAGAFITLATALWISTFALPEIAATDWGAVPPIAWIGLLYLAIFTSAGTFVLMQFAALRLPAGKVMAYGYLVPCFVILYEGLAGHGWVSPIILAGALVTVLGLLVLALSRDE